MVRNEGQSDLAYCQRNKDLQSAEESLQPQLMKVLAYMFCLLRRPFVVEVILQMVEVVVEKLAAGVLEKEKQFEQKTTAG